MLFITLVSNKTQSIFRRQTLAASSCNKVQAMWKVSRARSAGVRSVLRSESNISYRTSILISANGSCFSGMVIAWVKAPSWPFPGRPTLLHQPLVRSNLIRFAAASNFCWIAWRAWNAFHDSWAVNREYFGPLSRHRRRHPHHCYHYPSFLLPLLPLLDLEALLRLSSSTDSNPIRISKSSFTVFSVLSCLATFTPETLQLDWRWLHQFIV
jgi:hypothetical protein